jgi:hypothetical protein
MKKNFRTILKIIKWTILVIVVLAIISAVYNQTLPEHSKIVEHLSENEKAYIAETKYGPAGATCKFRLLFTTKNMHF